MSLRVPNLLNAVSELHIGKFPAIYSNIKLIISMLDNENSLKIVNTVIQVFHDSKWYCTDDSIFQKNPGLCGLKFQCVPMLLDWCWCNHSGVCIMCLNPSFFCSMSIYPSPYLNIFVNMVSSYGQFVVHDFPSDIHVCYCYSQHIYNIYWSSIHLFFCLCNIASDLKTTLHVDDPLLSYPGSRTFQSLSI